MAVSVLIRFQSEDEKRRVVAKARKAKMSVSNLVRQLLELEPLTHGGARKNGANTNAKNQTAPAKKPS